MFVCLLIKFISKADITTLWLIFSLASYDRQEHDADTEDYFSDSDRDKARYRDNYDSRYRDLADRERGQREIMEKSSRQRHDHR